jgi:dihydropteroate synthase
MSAMLGFSLYATRPTATWWPTSRASWMAAAERALAAGLPRESLLLDPGLGFAKNARHSLELCARLDELCALGFPVLVGPSRKSFVARAALEGARGASGARAAGGAPRRDDRRDDRLRARGARIAAFTTSRR